MEETEEFVVTREMIEEQLRELYLLGGKFDTFFVKWPPSDEVAELLDKGIERGWIHPVIED